MINKITDDFEKIVAVARLKELKRYAKNILPNYKKWKNWKVESRNKKIKRQK